MKVTLVFTLFLVLMGAMMASGQRCICPLIYQPVCGQDGNTYGSSCQADCAGVQVEDDTGACGSSDLS